MKTRAATILSILIICRLLVAFDRQEARALISEIKKCEYGQKFLTDHSEKNLYKMILFINDPVKYFRGIRDIDDWCGYLWVGEVCLYMDGKSAKSWLRTLLDHFDEIDNAKSCILTHLILNSLDCGLIEEALIGQYSRSFAVNPSPFVEDLKKRKNWKRVFDLVIDMNGDEILAGLAKLADSGFEKELKEYVREHYR